MVHELTPSESELPPIDDWRTGDSRRLLYTVTLDDHGTPKDITNDDVTWALLQKPYDRRADALLTDDDTAVTVQRDTVVDPTAGEFRVDVPEDTISTWGDAYQRVVVDPPLDSRQSWIGPVTVTARGGGDTL
jgi:hypothetical protein